MRPGVPVSRGRGHGVPHGPGECDGQVTLAGFRSMRKRESQ